MNAQELTAELKAAKVGKGCKFNTLSNCVTIIYPAHKIISGNDSNPFSYKGSQKESDVAYVLENYKMANGLGTIVKTTRRAIQIYIN